MEDSEVEKLAARMRADHALLGGWRRRRAAERLALADSPVAVTAHAWAVSTSSDERVVAVAYARLRELGEQEAIDAACRVWADTRDGTLGALVAECGWVASRPPPLRVLTALQAERMDVLADGDAEAARALAVVAEKDSLCRQARDALRTLIRPEAREAICALAIDEASAVALEAAVAGGFAPSDPARRALLLFLAGEFERYAELDFDGSLLAAAHAAADEGLRARLAERARTAGRVEWVRAVAGVRQNRRLGELSGREWEAAVGVLATTGRWEQLWRLALVAPPVWGARMLRELGQRNWQPSAEADRAGRDELTTLARACAADVPVEEAAVLEGHSGAVWGLAVTPDGGLLASSGEDGSVRLWRLPSGAPAGTLPGHTYGVSCLAVTPDGGLLASGGHDGMVRLWRLPSGIPAGTLPGHRWVVRCLAVTPDGGLLASGSGTGGGVSPDGTVLLWRLPSGAPAGTLPGHTRGVNCLAVTPDGGLLASGSQDGSVRLWRLPSGTRAGTLTGHTEGVRCLAVTPDGGLLASGSWDGTVRLWRLPSGTRAGTLTGHTEGVRCLAVTPDGGLLASGSWDGTVRLWRLPSGTPAGTLTSDTHDVSCLAVSPDGGLLASGSNSAVWVGGGNVRLWKLPSGTPAGTVTGHTRGVNCLAVSPDGGLLASGSEDGMVRLWRSSLRAASRTPVGDLAPADVRRLLQATNDQPAAAAERSWALLIAALVDWRRRHDIELSDAGMTDPAGASDIELEG